MKAFGLALARLSPWFAGLVVALAVTFERLASAPGLGADFRTFYVAAAAAARGRELYDVTALRELSLEVGVKGALFPYLYSPVLAYLTAPMASLSPTAAQRLWSGASVVAIGVAITASALALEARALAGTPPRPVRRAAWLGLAALTAWILPLGNNLSLGQSNPFVLALVASFVVLDARGHDRAAGAALGLAAALKLTPVLLLVIPLARGKWRTVAAAAAAFVAAAAATLVAGASPAWLSFFRSLPGHAHGAHVPGLFPASALPNFSLAGFYARVLGDKPELVSALAPLTVLLLLGAVAFAARRARAAEGDPLVLLAGLALMIIASPVAYLHHVVFLLPAALALLAHLEARGSVSLFVLALALLALASVDFPLLYGRAWLALPRRLGASLNLFALLGLGVLGASLALHEARRARAARALVAPAPAPDASPS